MSSDMSVVDAAPALDANESVIGSVEDEAETLQGGVRVGI
jgi:hypothetical protein